jgi:hypothetical protein
MLDGDSDTSGAILLFGVRPFAEKIPDEVSILQILCTLDRGAPPRGWGVNLHRSKSNGAADDRGEKPRETGWNVCQQNSIAGGIDRTCQSLRPRRLMEIKLPRCASNRDE